MASMLGGGAPVVLVRCWWDARLGGGMPGLGGGLPGLGGLGGKGFPAGMMPRKGKKKR